MTVWHVDLGGRPVALDGVSAAMNAYCRSLEEAGVPTHSIKTERRGVLAAIREATRLSRSMRGRPPRAVHLHSVYRPAHALLAVVLIRRGIPYVISPHSGLARQSRRRDALRKRIWIWFVERHLLKKALAVAVLSPAEEADVRSIAPSARCVLVPNPIEVPEVAAEPRDAADGSRIKLVTLCRFDVFQKGLDRLAALAKELPEADIIVHGSPDQNQPEHLQRLRRYAPKNFRLADPVYGQAKVDELRSADLYVQLSRWEGMSFALLEALAEGVPTVVSREISQTLGTDLAATVAEAPDNPVDAAAAVRELMRDLPRRRAMGAASRDAVAKCFTSARTAAALVGAYSMTDAAIAGALVKPPVRSLEVDLDQGWPQVAESAAGESPAGGIQVLIRLHGCPVGLVVAPLPHGGMTPWQLEELVAPEIAEAVMAHRWRDEQDVAATLMGIALAPAATPRCEQARERLNDSGPALDVVIPTRNRPDWLAECVDSILATGYRRVQVIVVDNDPAGPETADLVASRADWTSRVRYIREDRAGSSLARNRGIEHATAGIVAFVDDDVIVDRGWAAGLMSAFLEEPGAGCVTGPIIAAELATQPQIWIEEYGGFSKGFVHHVFDPSDYAAEKPLFPYAAGTFGSGANMAFRRETIIDIHGFDPALGLGTRTRGGEDLAAFAGTLLSRRCLVYEPSMMVRHRHHPRYEKLRQVILGYGVGLGAYLAKTVYDRPSTLLDVARRIPAGLAYLFSPESPKNARKSADYPRELTFRELAGLAWGPFAYGLSKFELRRRNKRRDGSSEGEPLR